MAGEKVSEARKTARRRIGKRQVRELAGRVRDKAVEGAKAADEAIREHPYQAIGIVALGLGCACRLSGRQAMHPERRLIRSWNQAPIASCRSRRYTWKQFRARRLLTVGANRLELLMVEVQEERERLLRAILLALSVAVFGLLAGMTLTGLIVVSLWGVSPVAVLATLTGIYAAASVYLYRRLAALLRDWKTLSATLDQLQKDTACLQMDLS